MALTQVKSDGIATGAVTATQIAANAVTVDDISDGSISTAKLADDAVTADKLADTAVTAGSYTLASVTVDAQGRITAASSGTAGDSDRIFEGNTSAEVVDTGSDGHFKVVTEGTERLRVANDAVYTFTGGNSASDFGEIILSGRNSSNLTRPAGKFLIGPNGTDSWTGEFTLQLRDDGGTFTGRFHVSGKTGNVGIGTTSPAQLLELKGSNAQIVVNGTTTTDCGIELQNNGTSFSEIKLDTSSSILDISETQSSGAITFSTGSSGTERMRLDSSGNLKFNSGYGSVATAYGVRAWVNFLGTGTVSIRDDGNVSSITDNGTGDYTVNFSTAMPDDDYCVFGSCVGSTASGYHSFIASRGQTITTSSFRFNILNHTGSVPDMDMVSVAVIR